MLKTKAHETAKSFSLHFTPLNTRNNKKAIDFRRNIFYIKKSRTFATAYPANIRCHGVFVKVVCFIASRGFFRFSRSRRLPGCFAVGISFRRFSLHKSINRVWHTLLQRCSHRLATHLGIVQTQVDSDAGAFHGLTIRHENSLRKTLFSDFSSSASRNHVLSPYHRFLDGSPHTQLGIIFFQENGKGSCGRFLYPTPW